MNLAIIGTGNMASALATRFVAAGHPVRIGARDAGKAR